MSRAALRPAGSGGAGPRAGEPLLDDVPASPASRLLASGPAALGTRPTAFFSNLLAPPRGPDAVELAAQLLGLAGIVGAERDRSPVRLARALRLPEGAVDVAEVLLHGGIGGFEPGGAFESGARQLDLALPEVDPAERVDVGAVVGIERHGALDQLARLVEMLAALGEHVSEVVERGVEVGLERQDAPELGHRLLALAGALVGGAEQESGRRRVLVAGDQPFEQRHRVGVLLEALVGLRRREQRFGLAAGAQAVDLLARLGIAAGPEQHLGPLGLDLRSAARG